MLPIKKNVVLCASDEESYKIAFDFFSLEQIPDIFIAQDIEKARYLTQASYFGSHNDCPPIFCIERQYSTCIKRGILLSYELCSTRVRSD
ncbi:hypothetical protein PROPEN_01342 [Proteus penneri ATCC 35198]|nr:hypothetical protein PROPEN_01342 [Proteus penneri ATCC 35198]